MNSVSMQILNNEHNPFFGPTRKNAGVSGNAIQSLALEQVKKIAKINREKSLNLSIIAVGGIMKPHDFKKFLRAGATLALSATGFIFNPLLAQEYQQIEQHERAQSWLTQEEKYALIVSLYDHGIIKFGEFTFKSGLESPIYMDLRTIISCPNLMQKLVAIMAEKAESIGFDTVCGVPYGAISFAAGVALKTRKPMIITRKETKEYGTQKQVDGIFKGGDTCLVIEDVLTTGSSCLQTVKLIEREGLDVKHIIIIMDYGKGGNFLREKGYTVHALFTFSDVVTAFERSSVVDNDTLDRLRTFYKSSFGERH